MQPAIDGCHVLLLINWDLYFGPPRRIEYTPDFLFGQSFPVCVTVTPARRRHESLLVGAASNAFQKAPVRSLT
jgi:hypothetical protein